MNSTDRNLLPALLRIAFVVSGSVLCTHSVAEEETSSRLLFRTGFEEDVEHVGEKKSGDGAITRLKGKDRQTECDAADFGILIPGVKDCYIAYNCGRPHVDSTSMLVDAPEPGHGRVLKFQVNSDDGEKYNARTACSFYLEPDKFQQLGIRYDFKIDPSFVDFPATQQSWWVMSEIWGRQYPNEGKVSLPVYLRLRGDKAVFSSVLQRRASNSWRVLPPEDAPVIPIGQWVTIDMFLKPGPARTGRFYLACNGSVVFDIADKDIGKNDYKMALWSVMKLYLDLSIVDGMRERGTPASVYYDNFEIWSGVPNKSL